MNFGIKLVYVDHLEFVFRSNDLCIIAVVTHPLQKFSVVLNLARFVGDTARVTYLELIDSSL